MLSIGIIRDRQYCVRQARADYYSAGGEALGRWVGRGAKALGFAGVVTLAAFLNALEGRDPSGTKQLVQIQKDKCHQPGWDFCFSAPKSVSVLWACGDATTRRAIQAALNAAVRV